MDSVVGDAFSCEGEAGSGPRSEYGSSSSIRVPLMANTGYQVLMYKSLLHGAMGWEEVGYRCSVGLEQMGVYCSESLR